MKPTLLRRKATFTASDICVIGLPQISISPLVGVRMPAMIEIRVVLPQPDGPTSIVSSPAGTSKSISCNTSTTPTPAGKDLVTLLQRTAMAGSVIGSASEDDRGVHHHDLAQAGKARDHDDHQNGASGPDGHLPRQLETAEIDRDARGDFEKAGTQPNADRIADAGDDHGLQQDHAQDLAVGYSHGLERAELAQIFENEDVEGLADHGGADDEAKRHGDAEIDRNAGSFQVIAYRGPGEIAPGKRLQSGLGGDPLSELMRVQPRPRMHQHKRHLLAGAADIVPRVRVFGVDDGVGREGSGRTGNADDHCSVIVEFDNLT